MATGCCVMAVCSSCFQSGDGGVRQEVRIPECRCASTLPATKKRTSVLDFFAQDQERTSVRRIDDAYY